MNNGDAGTPTYGSRLKIGTLIPAANGAIEPEYTMMAVDGVAHLASRLHVRSRPFDSDENAAAVIQSALDDLEPALERLMSAQPDVVCMAMAAPCFWGAVQGAERVRARLEAACDVPVILPTDAIAAALGALKISRIAVLTPEVPVVDRQIEQWFVESGYDVRHILGLQATSPEAVSRINRAQISSGFAQIDDDGVDALVQVGTSLAVATHVHALEQTFKKPVITVNTAMWWLALRRAGIDDRLAGFGKLLAKY